jgi:hypothetical protein
MMAHAYSKLDGRNERETKRELDRGLVLGGRDALATGVSAFGGPLVWLFRHGNIGMAV